MFGREALSCCTFLLFGSDCATIVQPEGHNGLNYTDVVAHPDVSTPTQNASARSWIELEQFALLN